MLTRDLVRQVAMAFAIAIAIYAQLVVHANSGDVVAWLLFPLAAMGAALVATHSVTSAETPRRDSAQGSAFVVRIALAGAAIAAIAATTYLSSTYARPGTTALLLWLAAPLITSLAVRGWQVTPARRIAPPWSRGEVLGLVAIVAVAALLRFLWIDSLPRMYFGDEPRVGMFLQQAYRGGDAVPNFFRMGWNTWPVVGLSLQGLFAPLFGINIAALRMSSALMGTLGVLATYLLARELFTPRAAVFAAFLLAVCRTAIDFSRLGITHAQIVFLEPLAFFFLWRALNGGRALAYLWCGVVTAWCLYSYNAGQLVPPLIVAWLALGAVVRPARLRTHWRGAALLAAAFAAILFPYLYYFTDAFTFGQAWDQWTIMARNRQTMGNVMDAWRSDGFAPAWEILSRQTWTTLLGFGVLPGGGYGLGYRRGGMLDDVSAALFAIGLGMAIRYIRNGPHAFLLYWFVLTVLVGGIATVDPPSFVRMVGLLPAVALLAALPLEWLTRQTIGVAPRAIGAVLAIALAATAAWDNYRTYFVSYASAPADSMSELVRYMQSLPKDQQAVLLGPEHHIQFRGELFTIEFPGRWYDVPEPAHFLPVHRTTDSPLAVVLAPTQLTMADYVRTLYPNAAFRDVTGPNGQPIFFRTAEISFDELRTRACLKGSAERADGSVVDLGCADPFAADLALPPDTRRIVWTGSLYWARQANAGVTVAAQQPTSVTIGANAPIVGAGGKSRPISLNMPRGWQPIRIEETVTPQQRPKLAIAAEPVTRWSLRPDAMNEGLLATYTRPDGTSVVAIDPQLNAFAVEDRFPHSETDLLIRTPFVASWRGALRVDTPGTYQFEALGSGPYSVRLDGAELFNGSPSIPEQPALARAMRTLDAGEHPITVEFDSTKQAHTTRRVFQLLWTPPGGTKQLIPPTNFVRPTS